VSKRYLITVRDEDAGKLEMRLGGALYVAWTRPAGNVLIAGLDAVSDDELTEIDERLRTSGPLYHAGGPG
jgi:hypothetical protein